MRVRRVVDLSVPLDAGTVVYPGDPPVDIETFEVDGEGFTISRLAFGSHAGTHADAPLHFVAGGTPIDAVDPALFVGRGLVIDVRHRGDREPITSEDVAPHLGAMGPGVLVLLKTGWSAHQSTPRYFDHPHLTEAACRAIVERGVRTIGVDALSLDETIDDDHPGLGWPCHRVVLGAGGVLLENLSNLDRIDFADPLISALPPRITGVDGSPVRAVALDIAVG
jgi:kynurenine formamidase